MTQSQSTQSTSPEANVNLAVIELKKVIQDGSEADLTRFMHGYALGFAADQFIGVMTLPGQRVEFFVAIAKAYPEDWKEAMKEWASAAAK